MRTRPAPTVRRMTPAATRSASFIADYPHEGGLFGREFRRDWLADVESVNKGFLIVAWIEAGQQRAGQKTHDHTEGVASKTRPESEARLHHARPEIGRRAERAPRDIEARRERQPKELEQKRQCRRDAQASAGRRRENQAGPGPRRCDRDADGQVRNLPAGDREPEQQECERAGKHSVHGRGAPRQRRRRRMKRSGATPRLRLTVMATFACVPRAFARPNGYHDRLFSDNRRGSRLRRDFDQTDRRSVATRYPRGARTSMT